MNAGSGLRQCIAAKSAVRQPAFPFALHRAPDASFRAAISDRFRAERLDPTKDPSDRSVCCQSLLTSTGRLVYNSTMDISTALLSAVLSAFGQTYIDPSAEPQPVDPSVSVLRRLPVEARYGTMQPPPGDGTLTIDGDQFSLSPTAQFRSQQNLLVVPMQIQQAAEVVYLTDARGAVYRVWLLNPNEASERR